MYTPSDKTKNRIDNAFTFHPAQADQPNRYAAVRRLCRTLAHELTTLAPESRELSIALTNLEQVMYWTNAAIARNEDV